MLLLRFEQHLVASIFFFNDTATTEIYTLSLHDALPISLRKETFVRIFAGRHLQRADGALHIAQTLIDRKSTRLNSSHLVISYAVFCLKKKKTFNKTHSAPCRAQAGATLSAAL